MLHVLDGKMFQKQRKVGEQRVLKQSNMSQNCINFQFLHMRFYGRYTVQKLIVPASYQNSNNFPAIGQFDYTLIPVISFPRHLKEKIGVKNETFWE